MLDKYGYISTISMALQLYERNQRGMGRTTDLLDRVKDGDLIICHNAQSRKYIESQLLLRGFSLNKVKVIILDPKNSYAYEIDKFKGMSFKRVHYDHQWIYERINYLISHMLDDLKYLEDDLTRNNKMNVQYLGEFLYE